MAQNSNVKTIKKIDKILTNPLYRLGFFSLVFDIFKDLSVTSQLLLDRNSLERLDKVDWN
jgi:hypothetical protein